MGIRPDSYSSIDEVQAFTRHLLDGANDFDGSTRPALSEVEVFVDRASGLLNNAILAAGFTPATVSANSTAKLPLDDWTTHRAAMYCELTQRGAGYSEAEMTRSGMFKSLTDDAYDFVEGLVDAWKRLGLSVADPAHQGLAFTGMDAYDERSDPDNTDRRQPRFRIGRWDNN
jgi:hypothetical protein